MPLFTDLLTKLFGTDEPEPPIPNSTEVHVKTHITVETELGFDCPRCNNHLTLKVPILAGANEVKKAWLDPSEVSTGKSGNEQLKLEAERLVKYIDNKFDHEEQS